MEFAFLDESGDIGGMGSKYLVSTLVVTRNRKDMVEIIVDMKKKLLDSKKGRKWLNRNGGEIKFHNFPDSVLLKKSISRISKLDIEIYSVVIDKNASNIDASIKNIIFDLYYGTMILSKNNMKNIKITADLNYFTKRNKKYYFKILRMKKLSGYDSKNLIEEVVDINDIRVSDDLIIRVEQMNSRLIEELQATDLISGCLFQKYENGKTDLFEILVKGKPEIIVKEKKMGYNTFPTRQTPLTEQ